MESVISNFRLAIDVLLSGKVLSRLLIVIGMFQTIVFFVQEQTYVNNKMQETYQYSRYTEHDLYAEDIIQLALILKGTEYKLYVNDTYIDLTENRSDIENGLIENHLSHDKRYECSQVKDAGTGSSKRRTYTFYVKEVEYIDVGDG